MFPIIYSVVFVRHIRLSNTWYQDFFFFPMAQFLKAKAKIKFHSLVTPHLCFYVPGDFKRKKLIHFVLCSCSQLWTAPAPWLTKYWRCLKSLNNNLNSVPHRARERGADFILLLHKASQVLENNKTHWRLWISHPHTLKHRPQVIFLNKVLCILGFSDGLHNSFKTPKVQNTVVETHSDFFNLIFLTLYSYQCNSL